MDEVVLHSAADFYYSRNDDIRPRRWTMTYLQISLNPPPRHRPSWPPPSEDCRPCWLPTAPAEEPHERTVAGACGPSADRPVAACVHASGTVLSGRSDTAASAKDSVYFINSFLHRDLLPLFCTSRGGAFSAGVGQPPQVQL